MAGKRQHFAPLFLQRGFARERSDGQFFAHVYRKGIHAFEANIAKIRVESHFYTIEEDASVDELITEAEGGFSGLVAELRAGSRRCLTDGLVPQLLAHLEARTRHRRMSFLKTSATLADKLLVAMSDEDVLVRLLSKHIVQDPQLLRACVAEYLAAGGMPSILIDPICKILGLLVPEAIRMQMPYLRALCASHGDAIKERIVAAVKLGHLAALRQGVAPVRRVDWYERLEYCVIASKEQLVLGDSLVLFQIGSERVYRPICDKDDMLQAICLPLEPTKVLIGVEEGAAIDVNGLRRGIARCSLEYFVAPEESEENRALATELGADADMLKASEVDQIVTELLKE